MGSSFNMPALLFNAHPFSSTCTSTTLFYSLFIMYAFNSYLLSTYQVPWHFFLRRWRRNRKMKPWLSPGAEKSGRRAINYNLSKRITSTLQTVAIPEGDLVLCEPVTGGDSVSRRWHSHWNTKCKQELVRQRRQRGTFQAAFYMSECLMIGGSRRSRGCQKQCADLG